jgi:DNA polymerase-1
MRHHVFDTPDAAPNYRVALLCKPSAFDFKQVFKHYVEPLVQQGVSQKEIVAIATEYDDKGKANAKLIKSVLEHMLPALRAIGTTHLYVTDSDYFKVLAKQPKIDGHWGYTLPCAIAGFEDLWIVLGVNYQQLIFNPMIQSKLDQGLAAIANDLRGAYQAPGTNIIHSASYPQDYAAIRDALEQLHQHPALTCDIEAFSLLFYEAGIGTVSFAWNEHEGIAFPCDYQPLPEPDAEDNHGIYAPNGIVRALLRQFFETYQGELIFHNAGYDAKQFVYVLWMKDLLDQEGLLKGLEIMSRHWHDTKLIAFLALNSCARQEYGLKALAHEFAGNYAVEVSDIRKQPLDKLLQYNTVDALSTWYVYKKYHPVMVRDEQLPVYTGMMLPSARLIVQIELTGMPMSEKRLYEVKAELEPARDKALATIMGHPMIPAVEEWRAKKAWEKDFKDRHDKAKNKDKIKHKDWDTFPREPFNPNSGPQMQALLYEFLELPVIDKTDSGLPATGGETLEKLLDHPIGKQHADLLQAFIDLAAVKMILGTFIPAFERGIRKADDGILWLHGSFKLGFVVSGRLSSEKPNLQNIPAKSRYGKLVKTIFMAPKGWIFAGADFNSLEDMISALTTKDPNKMKVYIEGFDGHSLRAVGYWQEEFPNIDANDPKQVNQLKKDDHPLRQESKAPTFALTYQGTYITLMTNLGWSEEKARKVEAAYHTLYRVSDEWVQDKLKQAAKDGYVTVAFGLRLRTPMLAQCVWGRHMPYQAAAEGRTAGNALGQSYCMLNNRAAIDFWQKVWAHPKWRTKVLPCALIHDAIYPMIKDDLECVAWVNRELVKSMQWQELPEIAHDQVKLGANLDLYWPDWAHPLTLPNGADEETILKLVREHRDSLKEKA